MARLTIDKPAQRSALLHAVAYMIEMVGEEIVGLGESLGDEAISFNATVDRISVLRERSVFLKAFQRQLKAARVGDKFYLKPRDAEVVCDGLEALADIQQELDPVAEVLTAANIQSILNTRDSWDVAHEIVRQVQEAKDSIGTAQALLDALNSQRD